MHDNPLTMTRLAESLDLSKAQVSRLAARGMPTSSAAAAREWRATNLHPSWSEEARTPGTSNAGSDAATSSDYWAARARKELAQAELAEISLARAKNALLEVEQVHRALFACSRMLRDQLLAVPNRLAAQVTGQTPPQAAELIRTEIRRCLSDFSKLSDSALERLLDEEAK